MRRRFRGRGLRRIGGSFFGWLIVCALFVSAVAANAEILAGVVRLFLPDGLFDKRALLSDTATARLPNDFPVESAAGAIIWDAFRPAFRTWTGKAYRFAL